MLVGLIALACAYQETYWSTFVGRRRTRKLGIDFECNHPNKERVPNAPNLMNPFSCLSHCA
jgi:hypothetical protein